MPDVPPAQDDRRADRGILARDRRLAEESDDSAEPASDDTEPDGRDPAGSAPAESKTGDPAPPGSLTTESNTADPREAGSEVSGSLAGGWKAARSKVARSKVARWLAGRSRAETDTTASDASGESGQAAESGSRQGGSASGSFTQEGSVTETTDGGSPQGESSDGSSAHTGAAAPATGGSTTHTGSAAPATDGSSAQTEPATTSADGSTTHTESAAPATDGSPAQTEPATTSADGSTTHTESAAPATDGSSAQTEPATTSAGGSSVHTEAGAGTNGGGSAEAGTAVKVPAQAPSPEDGPAGTGAVPSGSAQVRSAQAEPAQADSPHAGSTILADAGGGELALGQGDVVETEAGAVVSLPGGAADSDPITDMEAREREAGVDEEFPFGRPGRPLTKSHPFVFGFYGALGVLAAYILVQALTNARQVIILIVVALFLAVGLNPGVEALERIGISRRWAVLVVFLALVGFFVGFGFAIVPPLSEQTTAIIHNLTSGNGYLEQLQRNPRLQDWDHRYHLLQKARTALQSKDLGTRAANGVVGVGQVVLSGVFSTLTVLILTLYFLSSLPNITGFMYRLAPRSRRARVALLGDEILTRIGGYVAGNLLISLIAGVTTYIFLLIVDVPYALALALLVAITDLIPLVGATIGAIFVTAISFFSGFWVGIATLIFFAVYQQVENYIVQPRVMKRSVDVQPAVTIIAALIGGTLLGVIGALLAIPAAAAIALILREVVMPRQEQS